MPKKEVKQKKWALVLLLVFVIILVLVLIINQKSKIIKLKYQKQDIPKLFQLASEFYYNQGNYLDAIQQYNKIIEIDPKNYGAYMGLGNSYTQLGRYKEAIKIFEKTFSIGYIDFRTYYGLGLTYYSMEGYNKSYTNLKQAYELNPGNKAVVSYLINDYNALGLYDEAIKLAKDRLENDTNNTHYYRKIALAYLLKNDLTKALENAQKAVSYDQIYAPNYLALANVYLSMGSKEDALSEFKTALALRAENTAYEGLSVSYELLGDNEKSNKNSKAANFLPRNSFSLSLLGFALLNIKEYDKAIREFNFAISNTPEYYLPYKGLGKVYMEIGQKEKAKTFLQKAWELNNLDKETAKLLEQVK